MLNYFFLWAQTHYNISLKICFLDCILSKQILSWTNNDISKRMLFLLFPTILTKNFQIWDDGGIKNICDIWQESALVGDEFHLKALPSLRSLLLLLSKLRGERRLQTWSSSRRWQVTMSLSLPSASSLSLSLSLTLSFNIAMICNYHKLEQYFKRLMNLSNPNILFYENIKYPADS